MTQNKQWYAAKVKPHTERKIKDYLSESGLEHFIPFHTVVVEREGQKIKKEKPVIPGLIFIRTEKKLALSLPEESGFRMMFMRNLETRDFLVVPDKQMRDFIFVLDLSENAIPVSNESLRRGDKVRVLKGPFAGIEGELVRIKGHKRVVVRLEGLFSLATTYIPANYLEVI
ncbi:UpxY family transcription antiterminator [Bacteroidales bacterium OttesenSCG-928-L03]|nr:UpxY family transcription antiterminator [Bacteroidales bacterium OttesenSCG-928-L03]